jgi:hypothetical protein
VRQKVLVAVEGETEREVEIYAPGAGQFLERRIATMPAGDGPSRVRLRVVPGAAESGPLVLCHVFAIAGLDP